jgi:ATP-dependent DNA helicase RecG
MKSNKPVQQLGFDFDRSNEKPIRLWNADELFDGMSGTVAVDAEEDHRIERKSASYKARELGDYFSMWANTAPDGGIILIGVENDGGITGCSRVDVSQVNDLQRAGHVYACDARSQCKAVNVTNAKGAPDSIIAIRVFYRDDRVVETAAGDAFVRIGSTKKKLTDPEKRELQHMKGQLEIESEPVSLRYPEDFNETKVNAFAIAVAAERQLPERSVEEILQLRRLGKIKPTGFVPNLACALLFAKDPVATVPGCKIRFFRFEGTEEKTGKDLNIVKSVWIEGAVPELIAEVEKVVDAQIREFMRLGPDNQFYSVAEYPKDAWYEAVVNACTHRSYSLKNMHITIKMFDDRLEVESPGGFPPLVTPDNIYEMHQPRNPHLMDALFYLKYVQAANEGTRRIRDSMAKLGLPAPTFRQTRSNAAHVRVTLRNDVEHRKEFVDSDAFMVLGESLSGTLNEYEKRIVNHLAERGTINVTEAARIGGKRWQAAKKVLSALTERGILDHVHSKSVERDAGAYFVLKKRFSDRLRG